MHIVAFFVKSNITIAATQRNKLQLRISLEWLNKVVFGKEIAVRLRLNRENAFPCDSSNVQQSRLGAKKCPS